jgi:hypothetical protein
MTTPLIRTPKFSDQQKLSCVLRELSMRRRVYPGWVRAGKMKQEFMDLQIAMMEDIVADYQFRVDVSNGGPQ